MVQEVDFREVDGNIGAAPPGQSFVWLLLGASSGGTPGTITSIGTPSQVVAAIGHGPVAEEARLITEVSGASVLAMPLTTAAGSVGTVTQTGTGPLIAFPSPTPFDSYDIKLKVSVGGAVGTAKFKLSLDGGQTGVGDGDADAFTAASYPVADTGLTITFPAGTYVKDEVYSATAVGPSYSTGTINAAFDTASASPYSFDGIYVVGEAAGADSAAKAAAAAAMVSAIHAKQLALFNAKRPVRVLYSAPLGASDADLGASFASVSSTSSVPSAAAAVVTAWGRVQSAMPHGRQPLKSLAGSIAAMIAMKPLGKDASAISDGPGTGSLPNILSIVRDERATPGLDAQRFTTVKTFTPSPESPVGAYLENIRLMSPVGSDYKYFQHGQLIDVFLRVCRAKGLRFLSVPLDSEVGTGKFTEGQAKEIEESIIAGANDALVTAGHATAVSVQTDRTYNAKATEEVRVKGSVTAKVYGKKVILTVGFAL